jgi:glutathione peroxidase
VPLTLHHVGPVEPGGVDGHQQLGVTGHRGVPFFPVQLSVANNHGVHAVHPRHAGLPPTPGHASAVPGILGGMALFDIPDHTLQGDDSSLGAYAGKTLLVVNVASKCGLTPQYEGLERLQQTYGDRGFTVLGFPSNQFMGQEPGTPEEIQQFCSTTYGVSFPLFEKIDVNGEDRHPIYEELTATPDADGNAGDITWNFEKFLVSGTGEVIGRFRPQVEPEDPAVVDAIEASLSA